MTYRELYLLTILSNDFLPIHSSDLHSIMSMWTMSVLASESPCGPIRIEPSPYVSESKWCNVCVTLRYMVHCVQGNVLMEYCMVELFKHFC